MISLSACGGAARGTGPAATPHALAVTPSPVATAGAPQLADGPTVPPPTSKDAEAILALSSATEACAFDPARGFTSECDARDRWEAEVDLFANGKNDDALVWILEHRAPPARALAASKLSAEGAAFVDDAPLASRLFDVADRETSEAVGAELGLALAAIDLTSTGTVARVLTLLDKRSNRGLTTSLLEELATHDEPTAAIEAAIAAALDDPRPEIRQAAVLGLALADPGVSCPAWKRALADEDPSVGVAASHLVATTRRCEGLVDAVLSFLGAGQRAGRFRDTVVATTLAEICEPSETSRAQRTLAAALAEGFADRTLPTGLREEALRAALACSTDEQKFVERFAKDPDEWVRRMAKDLLRERANKKHRKARRAE